MRRPRRRWNLKRLPPLPSAVVSAAASAGRLRRRVRLWLHFLEMTVFLHGVSQRIPPRSRAGENLQFATAIIVEPLDAPLAGCSAVFENLGWVTHSPSVPSPQLWASSPTSRHDQRACRSCRL